MSRFLGNASSTGHGMTKYDKTALLKCMRPQRCYALETEVILMSLSLWCKLSIAASSLTPGAA